MKPASSNASSRRDCRASSALGAVGPGNNQEASNTRWRTAARIDGRPRIGPSLGARPSSFRLAPMATTRSRSPQSAVQPNWPAAIKRTPSEATGQRGPLACGQGGSHCCAQFRLAPSLDRREGSGDGDGDGASDGEQASERASEWVSG